MKRALTLLLALALCLSLSAPALAAELSDAAAAELSDTAAPAVEFSDVPAAYAFRQAILDCVERGILSGYDDGTFRPGDSVTRAQFCVMLVRAFYPGEDAAYAGLKSGGWYLPSAALLRDKGILFYGDKHWQDPQVMKQGITRLDMATFVANVLREKGYSASPADKDAAGARTTDFADIGEYYRDAVKTVLSLGVITGYSDGSFAPHSLMTRGQSAVVLYRMARCMAAAPGVITAPLESEAAPTTLLNGKQPTEENVLEIIEELRAQYPEDTDFSAGYPIGNSSPVREGTHPYERSRDPSTHTSSILGCGGWATLISDAAFGQAGFPVRKIPLTEARPGDVGVMLDKNGRLVHVFTIASRPQEDPSGKVSFQITEAATNKQGVYHIHWDREYSWQAGDKYSYDVWTRYPE